MNNPNLNEALGALATAMVDAQKVWDMPDHRWPQYSLHTQVWPSGACGFGGMAVASSKRATCVVLSHGPRVRVYHDGKFAYQVFKPSDAFHEDARNHNLMGVRELSNGGAATYISKQEDSTCR